MFREKEKDTKQTYYSSCSSSSYDMTREHECKIKSEENQRIVHRKRQNAFWTFALLCLFTDKIFHFLLTDYRTNKSHAFCSQLVALNLKKNIVRWNGTKWETETWTEFGSCLVSANNSVFIIVIGCQRVRFYWVPVVAASESTKLFITTCSVTRNCWILIIHNPK